MKQSNTVAHLPPLAFGEAHASTNFDKSAAAAIAAKAVSTLEVYEPAPNNGRFEQKAVSLNINGLPLVASASTPLILGMGASDDFHLMIPFFGRTVTTTRREEFNWGAGDKAVLFTQCEARTGLSDSRSIIVAQLNKIRLSETVGAILGADDCSNFMFDVHRSRCLDLAFGGVDFIEMLRPICQQIDALLPHHRALEAMGIDDWIYRYAVCLLKPELFFCDSAAQASVPSTSLRRIDAVCDLSRQTPTHQLTLTEMEQISGLSRRSLQYAFRKKFGLSPMEWQKQERLNAARKMLLATSENTNIADLALSFGFANHSTFSAFYRRAFGETPTATLMKRRKF